MQTLPRSTPPPPAQRVVVHGHHHSAAWAKHAVYLVDAALPFIMWRDVLEQHGARQLVDDRRAHWERARVGNDVKNTTIYARLRALLAVDLQ